VAFDRMRIARVGLLVGWILVSMLVVAGFAAFSAGDEETGGAQDAVAGSDLGRTVGAVSALSFVGQTTTSESASEFDLAAENDFVRGRLTTGTTTPSDKRGGVYVRSGFLTETEARTIISKYFQAADVNRAIRIAWCQSSFNPAAVNPATGASGLFQHLPEHWAERSVAAERPGGSIFDPDVNAAVAAWMLYSLPGGWSHWDCGP
jgi:hypothetical protein